MTTDQTNRAAAEDNDHCSMLFSALMSIMESGQLEHGSRAWLDGAAALAPMGVTFFNMAAPSDVVDAPL